MKPPIRIVCNDCLLSVELDENEARKLQGVCPHCGATIESCPSEEEARTQDYTSLASAETGFVETTPWVETWSTGTLGTIGRFQLRELLGDGGFGRVYQAYDPRLDRDVALKVLKPSDPAERVMERFFREARAAARLDHPNIVAVYDAGRDAGRCWIAYQYVNGRTLLRQRDIMPFDLATSVRIIRDLAGALDHAHREGVFHRDLKPTNVIIDQLGRPRLTDFGLARRAEVDSDLTRDGAILGTPSYMSPEQASGRSHLADERSDVYSLGVIFYELLCGRRPVNVPSEAPAWMAQKKSEDPPPPPRSINRNVPLILDQICRKALAPDPAQRHPNARALAEDLDAWLRTQQVGTRLSQPLVSIVLGIAAALLLMVGVRTMRAPSEAPRSLIATPFGATMSPAPPETSAKEVIPSRGARSGLSAPANRNQANPANAPAPPVWAVLVGNPETKKYHTLQCYDGLKIAPATKRVYFRSPGEAEAQGFVACKHCHLSRAPSETREVAGPP
jgi:serine/threonine protein kinase